MRFVVWHPGIAWSMYTGLARGGKNGRAAREKGAGGRKGGTSGIYHGRANNADVADIVL